MKRCVCALVVAAIMALTGGCSVYMAATFPTERNYRLPVGTYRAVVNSTLQAEHIQTGRNAAGDEVDMLHFKDGWPLWGNILRALGWGAADFFTVCLWEIAGTPLEAVFLETMVDKLVAEVHYDRNGHVTRMRVYNDKGKTVYDTVTDATESLALTAH